MDAHPDPLRDVDFNTLVWVQILFSAGAAPKLETPFNHRTKKQQYLCDIGAH